MRQTSYRIEHLCTLGKALVLHYFDPHSVADRLCAVLERLDPPDIQPHRRIELQRPPPRRRFWTSEQHTYLFSQLVDENGGGLCLVDCAGQFPEGLGHEAGLQADVAVAHLALDLGAGDEGGDRVDDDDVDRAGPDQHVGDLEGLLTGIGLRNEQPVHVDAELLGVLRVERVLGVDEGRDAALALCVGDRVQRDTRLSGTLGSEYLHDAAAGQAADAESDVEGDGAGRDHLDRHSGLVAHAHDGALAELALDLGECGLESLLAVVRCHEMFLPLSRSGWSLSLSEADATGSHRQFADPAATVDNVATGHHFTEQKFDQLPTRRFVPKSSYAIKVFVRDQALVLEPDQTYLRRYSRHYTRPDPGRETRCPYSDRCAHAPSRSEWWAPCPSPCSPVPARPPPTASTRGRAAGPVTGWPPTISAKATART